MSKLTIKQKILLEAIEYFISKNHYSPTISELSKLTNQKYPNSVFSMLAKLEEKGYIETSNGKARTIRIIRGRDCDKKD